MDMGLSSRYVIVAMHDRVLINMVALTITVLYNQIFDIGCFSRCALDGIGDNMKPLSLKSLSGIGYLSFHIV